MMKISIAIAIFSTSMFMSAFSFGQEGKEGSNRGVFFEFLGNGIFNSLNYDTRFSNKTDGWGGKVGFGFAPVEGEPYFSFPIAVNYLFGRNGHYFEVGGGANYLVINSQNPDAKIGNLRMDEWEGWTGSVILGYRYHPVEGGLLFRAGVTPMFKKDEFLPFWPQVSIGYAF
jgi:hypothetical protein